MVFFALVASLTLQQPTSTAPDESTIAVAAWLGFSPTALAGAGLSDVAVTQALSGLESAADERHALAAAMRTAMIARENVESAAEEIRRFPGDQQVASRLSDAKLAVSRVNAVVDQARLALSMAISPAVAADAFSRVQDVNRAIRLGLPPEFGALALEDHELRGLAREVVQEQASQSRGSALTTDIQQHLDTIRNDARVVAAREAIQSHLSAIEAVVSRLPTPTLQGGDTAPR